MDGQPLRYVSGSIHYFRVPQELWQDRLRKIRAGGYNAIQFVIPWNIHEPLNGHFDFDGQNDLISFIELAKKEFELLYLLVSKPGKVFSREEIFNKVWGTDVIVGKVRQEVLGKIGTSWLTC